MTVNDVQAIIESVETLTERIDKRTRPIAIELTTQYLGNRVVSRFFPEHYARVQIARRTLERYRDPS